MQERVWSTLAARYYLDDATDEQLRRLRTVTDRDLHRAVDELVALGALAEDEADSGRLRLTPLADWALRARYGVAAPGDQVAQIKVTLLDTDPPVWRRLLVPATIRLDRLDRVIQAAMGWTNSHLHMFIHHTGHYGIRDPDLPLHDERNATLCDLAGCEGDVFGYEYDLGDSWEHEVRLEKLVPAEPGGRYPRCLAGARACPPEDCGGTPGYVELVDTLSDPDHPNTTTYCDAWASRKASTSTQHDLTPTTPTDDSPQSYSPQPAPSDRKTTRRWPENDEPPP